MALPEPDPSPGAPAWMVTYGDMMSLLLTFFIMLFSMSEIRQEQKFQAMLDSLHQVFGYDLSMAASAPGVHTPKNSDLAKLASLGRARRANLMKGGAPVEAPIGDEERVTAVRPDADPTIAGVVPFAEDSDELTDPGKEVLRQLVRQIAGIPQKIEIRGHTSNHPLPPGSPFRDHWDLAYARARKVEEFLVQLGISPERMRVTAAAGHELRYEGTDPLLQKDNSRVEVLVLNETIDVQRGHDVDHEPNHAGQRNTSR
ncbi:MAG: flagellar motor protein MotB [Pirellulales bacterium]|nr:flagellar motor protein MotB [Pirellulales bacterium]